MKLVYKGKMGGLFVGPHRLVRGEEVEIEDPFMAEMIQGIKGVEVVPPPKPKKTDSKTKSVTLEEDPTNKDDA